MDRAFTSCPLLLCLIWKNYFQGMQSGKAKCCTCDGISFDYIGNIDTHFIGTLELDNFPYHIALQKNILIRWATIALFAFFLWSECIWQWVQWEHLILAGFGKNYTVVAVDDIEKNDYTCILKCGHKMRRFLAKCKSKMKKINNTILIPIICTQKKTIIWRGLSTKKFQELKFLG